MGFQNHLTKKAITAEKKATINGHIVFSNTPPVPGSMYAKAGWLRAAIQTEAHKAKNIFLILSLKKAEFKSFSFLFNHPAGNGFQGYAVIHYLQHCFIKVV